MQNKNKARQKAAPSCSLPKTHVFKYTGCKKKAHNLHLLIKPLFKLVDSAFEVAYHTFKLVGHRFDVVDMFLNIFKSF